MRTPSVQAEPRAARVGLLLFILLSISFTGLYPPYVNPNEFSRLLAVYSFVEHGTFQIDRAVRTLGDVEDRAISGGHEYSNKAPGLIFASIPGYRILRIFMPRPATPFDPLFILLRILVVTPVCVLALARFRSRLLARGLPGADLLMVAVAFGTPFLFYARSFFSHAWTASLLFLSLDLIGVAEAAGTRRRVGALLWCAGAIAGWAAISEYPLAILVGLLVLRSASNRAFRSAALFVSGTLLPLALLLAYNAVCFGSPFVLSSAREGLPKFAALAEKGFFGFGPPSLTVAFEYLLHPARGFLLFSPFFAWAFVGFVRWRRSGDDRADWGFCLASTILFWVAMTGYPNWDGGWSLGSRYLLPLVFPVACAIPYALRSPRSRFLFAVAVGFSVLSHAILTSTWVYNAWDFVWPIANVAVWFLVRGFTAAGAFGDVPAWTWLAPALSLFAGAIAFVTSLPSVNLSAGRKALALAAAMAAVAVAVVAPPGLDFFARVLRAEIYTSISGRDPNRVELLRVLRTARTPSERERAAISWQRYGPRRP